MNVGDIFNPAGLFVGSFIPNVIMEYEELTPADKLVFARLMQYAGSNGKCYPSQDALATSTGCNKRTIVRAIDRLEKKNLIKVLRPAGADSGTHVNNQYLFVWDELYETAKIRNENKGFISSDKMSLDSRNEPLEPSDKMSHKEDKASKEVKDSSLEASTTAVVRVVRILSEA